MPSKNLQQVVAYVDPDIKAKIEKELAKSKYRASVSSYIECVLREHFEKQSKRVSRGTA